MPLIRTLAQRAIGSRMNALLVWVASASKQRVARQSFWLGALLLVHMVGGLVTLSLTARILGVDGLGVFTIITAFCALIYGFAVIPGSDAAITFVTRAVIDGRPEEGARVVRFTLAASMGLALIAYGIIVALTLTAASLLEIDAEYKILVLLYGISGILVAANEVSLAMLRMADRIHFYLFADLASRLVGIVMLATVWLTDGGMTGVVLAYVAADAVSGLGKFAAVAVSAPQAGLAGLLRSASIKIPPEVVRFHTGAFWELKLATLVDNIDVILLARFAGTADVGLYRVALRIVDTARRPIGLIAQAARPEFSRQWYSGQMAELRRTVFRITMLSIGLAVVGFGLLILFREPVIRLFLGDDFSGVSPLLLILIFSGIPAAAAFRMLPAAVGRIFPHLLSRIVGVIVFFAAMLWLAPLYGASGAAWARTIFNLTCLLVTVPFAIAILRENYRPSEHAE